MGIQNRRQGFSFWPSRKNEAVRRILLIDPSQKGALPLYTAMIALGLQEAGLQSIVLANRELVYPGIKVRTLKWLPAGRWPKPPGTPQDSKLQQALTWACCAAAVLAACIFVRPDRVHFQYPLHARLDHFLVRFLSRFVPVVWTAHDVLPHDAGTNDSERARQLYRAVDAVLVHSRPAADQVKSLADVDAHIIEHPAKAPGAIPTKEEARLRLRLEPEARIAVAVGFIRTYKGYDLLANIWSTAVPALPKLVVMGELVDPSEADVVKRLTSANNTDIRLGYASDDDIVAAISAADIVLLPHAKGSDSGLLHLARAIGRPVLSSDTPQLASVVLGTEAGVVLPRDTEKWKDALCGELPRAPKTPPSLGDLGEAHKMIYNSLGSGSSA